MAIDQIAQSGLSSLSVIYYSAQLFRDAVRVYLEDLYPDEGSKYIDKMVDKVASVAIPIAVHQKCSETYGGRNNRKVETESGNDSNLLIVFYVQIMPDDFVMQLHRF
ncbi:hypothetical protein [Klebsiella pneumoniae]|uniref:hypothetical protein n=1 Tax=Klebsiella pneumoniae TaxID=573 RepID=UPI001F06245A|nr:hypothetical protein [Klebsiella pneumoniae]MCH0731474.1 hypothetical protein [Klebsiella pneumoniae]